MAPSLKSRLARLREVSTPAPGKARGTAAGGPAPGKPAAGDEAADLAARGWTTCGQGLWHRSLCFDPLPLGYEREPESLAGAVDAALGLEPSVAEATGGSPTAFDLETTGLSGGTGTVAFLAAFARPREGGAVEVSQYFMDDYPAEPAFIAAVDAELALAAPLISYNGSSFDLPLYRGRCVMNGVRPRLPSRAVDLLHTARRLYKRSVGECSLASIERTVIGMERGPDLPGALVPEAYFRYLREGYHEELGLAMDHNAADVRALLELYWLVRLTLARCLARESSSAPTNAVSPVAPDPLGLAWLAARADPSRTTELLEAALVEGDERAVRPLMRRYWKEGRKVERLRLVPRLPDDAAGLLAKSLYAERVNGDRAEALRLAEAARALGGPLEWRAAARAARLARRVGL